MLASISAATMRPFIVDLCPVPAWWDADVVKRGISTNTIAVSLAVKEKTLLIWVCIVRLASTFIAWVRARRQKHIPVVTSYGPPTHGPALRQVRRKVVNLDQWPVRTTDGFGARQHLVHCGAELIPSRCFTRQSRASLFQSWRLFDGVSAAKK